MSRSNSSHEAMTLRVIRIRVITPDGDGEAVRAGCGLPWLVSLPQGDFRWYGNVAEVKREIVRRCSYSNDVKFEAR